MQLLRVIVPRGRGSELMKVLDKKGAMAITCTYGYGSNPAYLSNIMHTDKVKKEIVMAALADDKAHEILNAMDQAIRAHDTSIAFTTPLANEGEEQLQVNMEYVALYVIVDRSLGHKAVQIAQENGARGATLVHGRGSAKEVKSILLNMNIEPEKDIVIMLIKKDLVNPIKNAIYEQMQLEKENKGIIYSLPVNEVRGLVDQN